MSEQRQRFYRVYSDPDGAYQAMSRLVAESGHQLRAQVVLSKLTLLELSESLRSTGVECRTAMNDADTVLHVRLAREWGRTSPREESGEVLVVAPTQVPNVYHVVSDYGWRFWDRVVGHALKHLYPHVSFPSLSTAEIGGFLTALCEALSIESESLRITRILSHSRITDPAAQRQRQTGKVWTDLSLERAFEIVREQNARIQKVHYQAADDNGLRASGHIGWEGDMGTRCGFEAFKEAVLDPASELASSRYTKLDNRERVRDQGFQAKPFFIEYAQPVFRSTGANVRLVHVLERMPRTSHAVIHANPYLHMTLLDRIEDTSCEVYVLSPTRIAVVPQTRSTPTALSRLCAHISKEFGEGELRDYSEVYP